MMTDKQKVKLKSELPPTSTYDLNTMSDLELKALCYEQLCALNAAQRNVTAIEAVLTSRKNNSV